MADEKRLVPDGDWLKAPTEAEAIAQFIEANADVVQQLQTMFELMASRGLPVSLAASMLIGGAVGALIEANLPAEEIRRFAMDVVENTIKQMQQRPRA